MTGGQPVDGIITRRRASRARSRPKASTKVVVLSATTSPSTTRSTAQFPAGTEFHDRAELDAVQRRLREMPGVTVLIYEQTCAAEKRRRRKKGELVDPARRLFINERVCEGCGDCSVQSNCVAVLPLETDARPQAQDRPVAAATRTTPAPRASARASSACSAARCARSAGRARRRGRDALRRAASSALPQPPAHAWTGPYDLLVTGVGGTGVVTVGALIAMAAHLEGKSASVLDFMGFAQKGGSVL